MEIVRSALAGVRGQCPREGARQRARFVVPWDGLLEIVRSALAGVRGQCPREGARQGARLVDCVW